jgi:hypothetical protein
MEITIHTDDNARGEYAQSSNNLEQQWRRYGEARRRQLVETDEWSGGTSFRLNKKCRPEKYFQLAERVRKEI